jgi:hypothetical protein
LFDAKLILMLRNSHPILKWARMDRQPPANLRPYGNPLNRGIPSFDGESFQAEILQRARIKLKALHERPQPPVGPDVSQTAKAAILALFGALFPGLMSMLFFVPGQAETVVGAVFIAATLAILSIPVFVFVRSRPSSPKRAMKDYFRCLGRGRYKRAYKHVVEPDRDHLPRVQPVIANLGQPTAVGHPFAMPVAFEAYWNGLIRWRPSCYCAVSFRGLRVSPLRDDVVLVDGTVKFTMNSSLWLFLFLVIGVFAILIDLATRTSVSVPVRKVLVRVNDEWRIFNGELMGADEHDLTWLQSA